MHRMIASLLIRNYALINQLSLAPDPSLNIITGETGAGKSIMLGALGLLLGNRADTKVLFNEGEKCVVEGTFQVGQLGLETLFEANSLDYDHECIIRREITPQGKSRAFINDSPVSLEVLRSLSVRLMDIHSQHDTLQLSSQSYQLSLIDHFGGLMPPAAEVAATFRQYRQKRQNLEKLKAGLAAANREKDFNQFQFDELSKAQLVEGEYEDLERELNLLENVEDIRLKLDQANGYLSAEGSAATDAVKAANQLLTKVQSFSTELEELGKRLTSVYLELKDIAGELEPLAENLEYDPERHQQVSERLSQLNTLLKKHGAADVATLIAKRTDLQAELNKLESLDEDLDEAEKELKALHQRTTTLALALRQQRQQAIPGFEAAIAELLAEVGMPNARLKAEMREAELGPHGLDAVQIMFSANKGIALADLKAAASGGEFSRLMLCVKYVMAGKMELPTLIFDEIDTGISGEIAMRVGRLMQQMAKRHQLIVITHMPQIAARGAAHFFVYKHEESDRTYTNIRPLAGTERLTEIAQMIGGANPSVTAIKNAKELIAQN